MKFTFLPKRHQRAADTTGGIFRRRGQHGCSSFRSPPPQLDGVGIGITIGGGEGGRGIVAIGTVVVIETLQYFWQVDSGTCETMMMIRSSLCHWIGIE